MSTPRYGGQQTREGRKWEKELVFPNCSCLVAKSCLTLLQPHGLSSATLLCPLGFFQARILDWVAFSFSRGSFPPRDQTHISCISRQILYHWATGEALFSQQGENIYRGSCFYFLNRWFICLFNIFILNTQCMPGIVSGSGSPGWTNTESLLSRGVYVSMWGDSKQRHNRLGGCYDTCSEEKMKQVNGTEWLGGLL